MKVITVIGVSNSGKTTLLNYVFERLKADGAEVMNFRREGHLREDIVSLLYWKGKKIVICSIGDDASADGKEDKLMYVKYGTELAKQNADVLINAVNTDIYQDYSKEFLNDNPDFSRIDAEKLNDYDKQIRQKQNKCQEIFGIL